MIATSKPSVRAGLMVANRIYRETSQDTRCTRFGVAARNAFPFYFVQVPCQSGPKGNELVIKSLGSDGGVPITEVTLLDSDTRIAWQQTDSSLQVSLPVQQQKPCEHAFVVKIE